MSQGFVYLRPTRLVSVRAMGPYQESVADAWTRLNGWLRERGIKPAGMRYGLARDNPLNVAPSQCRYDAACELPAGYDAAGTELTAIRMPGGAYLRRRIVGRYGQLLAAALPICNEVLPSRGLIVAANRPCVVVYFDDPLKRDVDGLKADVCFPISVNHASVPNPPVAA